MRSEILTANGFVGALVEALRALIPAGDSVADGVAAIIADVRARGDEAVLDHTGDSTRGGAPAPPVPWTGRPSGLEALAG